MLKCILNTWTFCLLFFIIIPKPILNASLEYKDNKPKTMYDALVQKCPKLEKSELQENVNDIFTKKCVDWAKINASNTLSKDDRDNTACLVLYESVLSFCTGFGDHDIAKYKGLIPATAQIPVIFSTYTLDTLCWNNTFKESLNKSEHNISHLLEPKNCVFICADFAETDLIIKDICKFSYYFATFDVNKFIQFSNELYKNANSIGGIGLQNNLPQAPDTSKSSGVKVDQVENQDHNSKNVNSPQTGNVAPNKNVDLVQSPPKSGLPKDLNSIKDSKHFKQNLDAQANESKNGKLTETHIDAPKEDVDKNEHKGPSVVHAEEFNRKIAKNESKVDIDAEKKEPSVIENPLPNTNEDSEEVSVKGQEIVAIEADQDELQGGLQDEEEEEQKDYAKEDHEIVKETDEQKSIKKEKPLSTVQDEAISNYNSSEDDMDGDSYFFSYFIVIMCLFIIGYVGYHNRQKIFALLLEGKRGKRSARQGKRPNSANYHKLDSNLEEAISSSCSKNASNVIY